MEWADIRPVNHPEPADTTPESDAYFDLAQAALDEHPADWTAALQAHGIHPDEPHLLPAAIAMRRQRLTLTLAADAPGWLTYWYGPRPTDPAGAQVWDDEISQLAAWRDARHLDPTTPGYGPQPADPNLARRWAEHQDRSLATRDWLHDHTANLPAPAPAADRHRRRPRTDRRTRPTPRRRPASTRPASSPPSTTANSTPPTSTRHSTTAADSPERTTPVDHRALATRRRTRRTHQAQRRPRPPRPLADTHRPRSPALARPARRPHPRRTRHRHRSPTSTSDSPTPAPKPSSSACNTSAQPCVNASRSSTPPSPKPTMPNVQLLNQHRERLTSRIDDVERQIRSHGSRVAMWNWGRRPDGLVDADRNDASTTSPTTQSPHREPWLTNLVSQWHTHHPTGSLSDLHRLVSDVAAYRERAAVDADDPLGPSPTVPHLHQQHNALRHRLDTAAPEPSIGGVSLTWE